MIFKILLSASCLYLAFPNIFDAHGFWPLAWFFAVPLFDILDGKNIKEKCWIGVLSGLLSYGLLVQWLWPVHEIGTIFFVLALSIQTIIFCSLFLSCTHSWLGLIYVPALWVASEFVRTWILQGFCWSVGYSQSFQPSLIQLAAWTGTYGVSFVIVFVNYCLYKALRIPSTRTLYLVMALAAFAGTYAVGAGLRHGKQSDQLLFSVCAVQPNISSMTKLDLSAFDRVIETQVNLTEKALSLQTAHFIVWPETSFPADLLKDRVWYPRLAQIAVEHGSFFLLGAAPMREGKTFNSAVLLDPRGKTIDIYDKQFLVPFSEHMPSGKWFSGFKQLLHSHGFDFTPGNRTGILGIPSVDGHRGPLRLGVMICSEVCYPSLVRRLAGEGADFAVVILNDGWFTQPAAIMMHAQNTIMRAVEAGFDIVSVGNTGLTARVSREGMVNLKEQLPLQREAYGFFAVYPSGPTTVYARIGDFFAMSCLLFVIIILTYQFRKNLKKT